MASQDNSNWGGVCQVFLWAAVSPEVWAGGSASKFIPLAAAGDLSSLLRERHLGAARDMAASLPQNAWARTKKREQDGSGRDF
jgi:hypothetical protein